MPVKWTPENDHILLLKILETHELSVDARKVAAAWPGTDPNAKPTPRAITERLVRMRQMVKSSSAGHFSIGGGKGTPRKSRGNANSAASTPAKGKRKSDPVPAIKAEPDAGNSDAGDTEVDELIANTPSKVKPPPQSQTGVKRRRIKKESSDSEVTLADLDAIDETPSKRVRTPAPLPKDMVVYQGQSESESNVYESSMSEFVPEDSVGQNEDDKDIDDKVDVTGWA